MRNSLPNVALIVDTGQGYGRGVLAGISSYMLTHQPWSIHFNQRNLNDPPTSWLEGWNGQGAIVGAKTKRVAHIVAGLKVPVVDTQNQIQSLTVPAIMPDQAAVARAAADHLLERHFQHFAFVGEDRAIWSTIRRDAFVDIVQRAGFHCYVYSPPSRRRNPEHRDAEQNDLANWLLGLPKPIGVMAAHDLKAIYILDSCRRAGLAAPEQVAVLGVDNDEMLCNICDPPLSSVRLDLELIGYKAAELLDQLMQGKSPPKRPIAVAPLGVVTRRSTDEFAISDPLTAQAVRYIHRHACSGVSVADVARHCDVPRRVIERSFSKLLGTTPHRLIVGAKLARAKQLLTETDYALDTIAAKCGVTHAAYLNVLFKKELGQTPGEYRRVAKNGHPLPITRAIVAADLPSLRGR